MIDHKHHKRAVLPLEKKGENIMITSEVSDRLLEHYCVSLTSMNSIYVIDEFRVPEKTFTTSITLMRLFPLKSKKNNLNISEKCIKL